MSYYPLNIKVKLFTIFYLCQSAKGLFSLRIIIGPESGKNGGYLLAAGTPEEVSLVEQSYTGQYLSKYL